MKRAFTLLEVMMVIVILGILAVMVIPRFEGVTDDARTQATQTAVGGVRSSIAAFRARAVVEGDDPFPTLAELNDIGTVLQQAVPQNPFNDRTDVQEVSEEQANARDVVNPGAAGWNYFVDNDADPPVAVFYANSEDETTVDDGEGGVLTANEL